MVSTQNGSTRHFKDKLLLVCSWILAFDNLPLWIGTELCSNVEGKLQKHASLCKIIRLIVLGIEGCFFIDTNMVE
jgi:hypothetical protein